MDDPILLHQAAMIADELPSVMRQLFTFANDPADDLPLAQLRVCSILSAGSRPMSALSREVGVSVSAMTQIADRLERARLVKRIAEGTDRRVRCLQLTPRGEKMMHMRRQARIGRVSNVLANLSPEARAEVTRGVELLLNASREARETPGGNGGNSLGVSSDEPAEVPLSEASSGSSDFGKAYP